MMEAIDLSTSSLPSSEAVADTLPLRARRCLGLLDLIDSHIMMTLERFDTSVDEPLEGLRETLQALAATGAQEQGVVAIGTEGYARQCRRQIIALGERLQALDSAAAAVACAFYYLRGEFAAYDD